MMKPNYPLIFFPVLLGTCLVGLPKATMAQLPSIIETLPPLPENRPLPTPDPSLSNPSNRTVNPSTSVYRYRVFVDSTNNFMLDRVRDAIPDAFIRRGEGVIQAGAFREEDKFKADLRVQELAARGITARIVDSSTGRNVPLGNNNALGQPNTPNPTNFPSSTFPNTVPDNNSRDGNQASNTNPYFVIIPSSLDNLPSLAGQVVNFGISQELVRQREEPRGPHVIVGPFADRGLAQQWEDYLRNEGLDARVYFEK